MKTVNLLWTLLATFVVCSIGAVKAEDRVTHDISLNWKFNKGNMANAHLSSLNDATWSIVSAPHTWNNLDGQDGGSNYWRGISWYRKKIDIPAECVGRQVWIRFNGVGIKADLYVNGNLVGTHTGSYAAFNFDITPYLSTSQSNTIAVKVDNSNSIVAPPLSGDFNFVGGLLRTVELIYTNKLHITMTDHGGPGVYITPRNITQANCDVFYNVLVKNDSIATLPIQVKYSIYDRNNLLIQEKTVSRNLASNKEESFVATLQISNPVLWNGLKNPYLYKAIAEVSVDGKLYDRSELKFGVRYYSVDANKGFYLNGEPYPLRGICFHEDMRNKSRAISDDDRLELVSQMAETGANFFRLSHYQHGQFTYNYCDSAGIALWTEIPFVDRAHSGSLAAFTENCKQQLKELIAQNYNHPSVLVWGLGNEVASSTNEISILNQLNSLAKETDDTRMTAYAIAGAWVNSFQTVADLLAYNIYPGWYQGAKTNFKPTTDNDHRNFPHIKLGVSEYGAGGNIDHHEDFPAKQPVTTGQWHAEEYQAEVHESCINQIKQCPYLWETSVWVGADFSCDQRNEGNMPGMNDKGLITHDFKTKKDAYFIYKANWSKEHVVHLTSKRYVLRPDSTIQIKVYANSDSVQLFVNGAYQQTLIPSADKICIFSNQKLRDGHNPVKIIGYKNLKAIADSAIWDYNKPGQASFNATVVKVNFETTATKTPEGYIKDDGNLYNDRPSGFQYGWTTNNTGNARERSSITDVLKRTFNHMQLPAGTLSKWEIGVPAGRYKVTVMGGDPDYIDSKYAFNIEGKESKENGVILNRYPTTKQDFPTGTETVEVYDGKLTIAPGAAGVNVKIGNLIIEQLNRYIPSNGDIQINFGSTKETPYYINDQGLLYGNRGNGKHYGWSKDLSSAVVVRTSVPEPIIQSFIPIQSSTWEIELPNGEYIVGITCGDADDTVSEHQFEIEGVICPTRFIPTSQCKWGIIQDTVVVTDKKLTLKAAPTAINAKINAIHISKLPIPQVPQVGEINILKVGNPDLELPLTSNSSNPYILESNNRDVISVVDGKLRLNKSGDAMITITQNASPGFLKGKTSVDLHVYPDWKVKPFADFIAVNDQKDGTLFVDKTIGSPTSWSWSFEGGIPATSSLQNPEVFYSTLGTFDVSLTATNSLGASTIARAGYITVTQGTTDLALHCPVTSTQLEFAYQNLEQEAVDGDDKTKWAGALPNAMLSVDLQRKSAISEISILWGEDYAKSFRVETSNDHKLWTTVKEINNQTLTPDSEHQYPQKIDGLTNALGRFVRVNCTQSNTSKCYSIYTLSIRGYECAMAPIEIPTAQFNYTKEATLVTLANQSSDNATAWEWHIPSLGDTLIYDKDPIVNFDTHGIKTINLIAINAAGRSESVKRTFGVLSGVDEFEQSRIKIYPNPVKDQLVIEHSDNTNEEVFLYNSLGAIEKRAILDQSKVSLDMSTLPNGVYVLTFKTAAISKKIVKAN